MIKKLFLTFLIYLFSFNAYCGCDFDGTDGFINLGDVDVDSTAATISLWVYASSWRDQWQTLIAKRPAGSQIANYSLNVRGGASNIFQWFCGDGSFHIDNFVASGVSTGVWHHFLGELVQNGTSLDSEIWVDNVSKASTSYANTNLADCLDNTEANIGCYNSGYEFFDGHITEVAMWNAQLTAQERTLLTDSKIKGMPYQIQPASLVGYWPLDDLADSTSINAQTFKDRAGTNDGTGSDAGGESIGKAEEVLSHPD